MLSASDLNFLRRCVELAEEALVQGNPPFGSLLVSARGEILFEDCNRTSQGDPVHHPEFVIARWAGMNLSPDERASATVYTSGEHCPMCSAAHGWAGLGRIVYASSSAQLGEWLRAWGIQRSCVRPLAIGEVLDGVQADGPAPELSARIHELQRRYFAP